MDYTHLDLDSIANIVENFENPSSEDARFSVAFNSANEELNNTGLSMDNPALMQEYDLSAIELSKKGNYVTLSKIVTAEPGQGNGTRFMDDLTKNADANVWTLALTPDTTYGATWVSRLKKFYKRFGFKENKGRNADFNTRESLVRVPKRNIRFSASGPITYDNFYKETAGIWEIINPSEVPSREADYTSTRFMRPDLVSSRYLYGSDEKGDYVIRESDHWSATLYGENSIKDLWLIHQAENIRQYHLHVGLLI